MKKFSLSSLTLRDSSKAPEAKFLSDALLSFPLEIVSLLSIGVLIEDHLYYLNSGN